MTFHEYFNCVKGKFVNYSNTEFQAGLVVVEAFKECVGKLVGAEAKKRTTNRELNKNYSVRYQDVCCHLQTLKILKATWKMKTIDLRLK